MLIFDADADATSAWYLGTEDAHKPSPGRCLAWKPLQPRTTARATAEHGVIHLQV